MEQTPRELPRLEGERVLLRLAQPEDAPRILAYYQENLERLRHSMPNPSPTFLTEENWREQARRSLEEWATDRSARFFVFLRESGDVVGTANFTVIQRGPAQTCNLGYGIARAHEGRGVMTEALRLAIDFAFGALNVHRISANHRPTNVRSGRLLRKLGFVVEGYARDYLLLDGEWQDHVLTSLTNGQWRPA